MKLSPEKRTALLAELRRRAFYLELKDRYGKETAERYLVICSKPKRTRNLYPDPHIKH